MSGYGFTPLPPKPRVVERPQARFDRRVPGMVFGRLELSYKLDQPVHIGAGRKLVVNGGVVRATVRSRNTAVVPGSSWKGAVRARFEAITYSCAQQPPRRQKKIVSQTFPGYSAELDRNTQRHAVFKQCRTRAGVTAPSVCPACALFGLMNRRARVTFADLVADQATVLESIAQQYSPRLHHVGEIRVDRRNQRLTVHSLHGRKFHGHRGPEPVGKLMQIEVIPAGASISGSVRLHNVDPAELGGLLVALGFSSAPSFVKIGAGKNLGFGRVRPTRIGGELKIGRDGELEAIIERSEAAFYKSADRWEDGEEKLREIHKGNV